jgi:hypothetical protein
MGQKTYIKQDIKKKAYLLINVQAHPVADDPQNMKGAGVSSPSG